MGKEMRIKNGFLVCPTCRQRTEQRVTEETRAEHLPVWCRRCKHEFTVNIKGASAEICGPR